MSRAIASPQPIYKPIKLLFETTLTLTTAHKFPPQAKNAALMKQIAALEEKVKTMEQSQQSMSTSYILPTSQPDSMQGNG